MTKAKTVKKSGGGAKPPPVSARAEVLGKLVKSVDEFQLWKDVEAPLIMRTRVTSLNRAMKCGGLPGGMLGVLHGPSQGGKTLLVSEFLHAAWATGGMGLFCDAECRGVDLKWFSVVCGHLDEVIYYKPKTFEEFVERVTTFRQAFRSAKVEGLLPEGAMLCVGVDSLNRLAPADELKTILKGQVAGRKYPLRAMLIAAWLDGLIPTLQRDEVIVGVLREGVNLDAQGNQKKYKVKGGNAPIYDGGWVFRVTAASTVRVAEEPAKEGQKAKSRKIGEKHEIEVIKNSMGPKENSTANFYSSLGSGGDPAGLDFAREVREETIARRIAVYRSNVGYHVGGEKVSEDKAGYLDWLRGVGEDGRQRFVSLAERLDADDE